MKKFINIFFWLYSLYFFSISIYEAYLCENERNQINKINKSNELFVPIFYVGIYSISNFTYSFSYFIKLFKKILFNKKTIIGEEKYINKAFSCFYIKKYFSRILIKLIRIIIGLIGIGIKQNLMSKTKIYISIGDYTQLYNIEFVNLGIITLVESIKLIIFYKKQKQRNIQYLPKWNNNSFRI